MDDYTRNASDIERASTDGLSNISHAGLFARFVAFIVDLAIMAFVAFSFVLLTQNTVCKSSSYVKKYQEEFYSYQVESGLFEKTDDPKAPYKQKTFDTYLGYQDMFYSYYTDYLVNKCPEKYRTSYDGKEAYWFNVHVLGQPDDLNLYPNDLDKLHDIVKNNAPALFTYKLDGDTKLYNELALPKCQNNDPSASIDEENQKKLIKYFYIPDSENTNNEFCYYYIATLNLTSQKFVSKAYDNWYMHYYTLPLVCSFSLSYLIFFFTLPMIFKNGETIGKLIFHLGIVNKLGYRLSRLQLIPRYLFMIVIVVALYLFLGLNLWFLGIITFLALASYALAIFTKEHKAIHDWIAGTIVIDKNHSEIFENATQEEQVKNRIESVQSLVHDVEMPKDDETVLYRNKNYDNQKDKEG